MHAPLPPFRPLGYRAPRVEVERRPDGSLILTNPYPLLPAPENLIAPIRRWAREAPERDWLCERDESGGWRRLTFAQAWRDTGATAAWLLRHGFGAGGEREGAVMILSGNSIAHAVMTYGAMLAGLPVAPVSRAYSLMSRDFSKLKYVFELIAPRLIFVEDGPPFDAALGALDLGDAEIVFVKRPPARGGVAFDELLAATPGPDVEASYRALNHETVAKYLFTSGSTGLPKAAINTHGMMCVNAVMTRSMLADPDNEPPGVSLSWLPWNHTFGGNAVLNGTLTFGGTLYLDDGAPQPGMMERTIRNLKEISPTGYSSVPAGFAMLVPALESDAELRTAFFRRLKALSYGGAALGQDLYDRIQRLAIEETGERIAMLTGYGATETAPTVLNVHWAPERMGLIGLPLPGVTVKLEPRGDRYEVKVKGPAVTPGYYKREDLTAKAFDAEGFYSLGDAARFADPQDPVKGLVFGGRIAEDFKLDTGTWVNAGRLRIQALEAGGGLISDCLVAGLDKPYVAILAWPALAACREVAGADLTPAEVCAAPAVHARIAAGFATHNAANPGSSTRLRRVLLMEEPPNLDAGEITDKGYINQALGLARRAKLVERLFADPPDPRVIVI